MGNLCFSQNCNPTNTPTVIYYPNTTSTPTAVSGYEYLCGPNTVVYDTINSGCHFVYINPGCNLIFKYGECAGPSDIWIKNGGTLTLVSTSVSAVVFYEPSAVINNSVGASITSNSCTSISFPTVNCTGVGLFNSYLGDNQFRVYPNPTREKLIIECTKVPDEKGEVALQSLCGEILLRTEFKSVIDLSAFPNGIYFLSVQNCETRSVFKIIKER